MKIFACAVLGLLAVAARAVDPLVLADGPAAACPIVLAADATAAERFAADELARYLHRICGATFAVTSAVPASGPAIALAADPAAGSEAYRLRADPAARRLTISGGRPRGVLYGVYALLDEEFGCRWFQPDVETVPHRPALELPGDLDRRGKPRFEYREVFWTEAFDGDWAARNRLNASHARLEERHGGRISYGRFVHTFNAILDPDEHFKAHPEYFSMVKGRRTAERTQLCLTNPDVLTNAIRTVREWIRSRPDATIFSVSQNDWYNPCACPPCKALDDAEGSHAGTLLTFVNAVADDIAKDFPGLAIDTLAYQYTRKPPKTVRPRPNVIVRLCSIECCFAHPLDGCPEKTNREFMDDLRGWNKLTHRLYIWDYTTDFAHYLLPFPNLDVLDANVRTFADHGVAGLFEQGNYSTGGGGELAPLRAWVLARLLWDPSRNGDALMREFVAGVYGPAAPDVQRYLELRRETARRAGNHVRIFDGPVRPDLEPADLRAWDEVLARAGTAAGADAALRARIERLRMPVWYTRVWQSREPVVDLQADAQRLAAAARELKLTNFRESGRLETDLKRLDLAKARRPWTPPAGIIAGEDAHCTLHADGDLTEREADPAAEDGVAIRLAGRTMEWAIQWRMPTNTAPGRYLLRARLRIDRAGDAGPAFHGGGYDTANRKGLGERTVAVSNTVPGYRIYDLAEFALPARAYAYLAPNDNEAAVKAIHFDRFELVPVAEPPAPPPPAAATPASGKAP